MKIVAKGQFNHTQLASQKTGEIYSLSEVVSQRLGSKQLFIHHDIIAPGNKSSGPHRHTIIEEAVYIVKGTATVVEGKIESVAAQGTVILFDPKDEEVHFLVNRTDQNVETMTFSINSDFDLVVFDQSTEEVPRPSSHFDQDLRDVPDNVEEWIAFLDGLRAQLKDEDQSAKKLLLLEQIRMAARRLLRFDQAKSLIDEKPVSEVLQAAYHQHVGKLYFDQQYFGKAQAEFSAALRRWGRNFSSSYVRKAMPRDAEAIHRAHVKSIQEIPAWGHRPTREDQRVDSIKNDLVWVVEDNGSIEGYGHLKIFEKDGFKRGHIFWLYLTPKVIGKSLGEAIVDLMMEEINSAKVKKVSLEATFTAQSFYHKLGFVDTGPETTVEICGTRIRCYPMKMEL